MQLEKKDAIPKDWTTSSSLGWPAKPAFDKSEHKSGTRSLRLEAAPGQSGQVIVQRIPAKGYLPNQLHTSLFWGRAGVRGIGDVHTG